MQIRVCGELEFAIKKHRGEIKPRNISCLGQSSFFNFHAPNRPRRSATADSALAVLRTGAAVAVAVAVTAALLAAFFTDLDAAAVAERRGRCP
jgi:hypothetical protein